MDRVDGAHGWIVAGGCARRQSRMLRLRRAGARQGEMSKSSHPRSELESGLVVVKLRV
ncbi:hypothetical protein ACFPRL_22565 [Pseudoclavibacter helvolus]